MVRFLGIRNLMKRVMETERGVTLVELLVALLIAGLVFAGVYQVYTNSIRTTTIQEQVSDMQQNARVVMDQLVRELRLAGFLASQPTGLAGILNLVANPIELNPSSGTPQPLIIQGDFDNDNKLDRLEYRIDLTDPKKPWLTRQLDSRTPANFGANIENLRVIFYDADNCQLGTAPCPIFDAKAVKRVTLQLTARTEKTDKDFKDPVKNDGYRRRTLESDVLLRNIGDARDTTPPQCPKNVKAQTTGDCRIIRVTWDRPADPQGDLAGYYIYHDQNAITAASTFVSILDQGPDKTSYLHDLSVPAGGTEIWNIAVNSYDQSGNLCDSNSANGNPPADPVTATGSPVNISLSGNFQAAAPGNARAVPSDNQVTIDWAEVSKNLDGITDANDLIGYRLFRSTSSDMSGEVLIADEFILRIQPLLGGGYSHTTQYVDNDANTFLNNAPAGPDNCQIYYYQVVAVDDCQLESPRSTVISQKPNGTFSAGVTPPDNGKKPPAPTITTLLAGDDTSSAILNWTVPAPETSESTPVGVKIYWRVKGTSIWNPDPMVPPIDIPITSLPVTGQQILNGLERNTWYDVKVTSYDDPATQCGDTTDSADDEVFTGACAPKNNAHKIVPGIGSGGTSVPSDGTAEIGLLSPSAERYATWVVDPHDCTPDSSTFGTQGFDFKNPPAYDSVAFDNTVSPPTSAHVEFFINPPSAVSDTKADEAYGTAATGSNPGNLPFPTNSFNIDYAPRGSDGYYHFPSDPLDPTHIDTSRFCDADYDFKIKTVDGEQYTAVSAIPLEIKNGGLVIDSAVTVTSDITTPEDTHHIVRFGIKNTNAVLDLKLNKITLSWENNNAFLEKLEVLAADKSTPLGKWDSAGGSPSGRVGIGTELTLNPVPTIQKAGSSGNADKGFIRLTFKNGSGAVATNVDMRAQGLSIAETVTITRLEQQDAAATGTKGICTTTEAGAATVHRNPTISASQTVQNQPAANTLPSAIPALRIVPAGQTVTVSTVVTPYSATLTPTVKGYYWVDNQVLTAGPLRPSSAGGGGFYTAFQTGSESPPGTWNIVMPSNPDTQIWFYLEAMDGTAGDSFNRNFDIFPEQSVFTYVECGTGTPSISITTPSGGTASGNQVVDATVTTSIPLSSVKLTVTDNAGFSNVPTGACPGGSPCTTQGSSQTYDMCRGTGGSCTGTAGGTSQAWTKTYQSDDTGFSPAKTSVKHSINITATDACGKLGTASKNLN